MDYENEPDPDLAAELRQGAGREWSEEAAEDERLTELHRRRRLTLADRAKEMVNRGDRVSVEFGTHTFSGAIVAAGADYATIEGPGQTADVKLDEARWSLIPSEQPVDAQQGAAESFRALLHEYSAAETNLRLALPGGDTVMGTLAVIADDHVDVSDVDGRLLVVPMRMILAVVRSSDLH